ncbi:MAG: leucyl aminopeptidase, partial [Solirubrobacterales bacterium]|nr:leucyl aminopeptidase [Solirubrobacterales bacterium]
MKVSLCIDSTPMKVMVNRHEPLETGADLTVVGLYEDGTLPGGVAALPGAGEAKGAFKKLMLLHSADGPRVLIVGLGKREEADAERLRVAAALAAKEAGRLRAGSIAWALPENGDDAAAEALVTGTILGAYRFDRFKGKGDPEDPPAPKIESLTLLGPAAAAAAAETARIYAEAQNRARDLQSTPANVATPSYLAGRAEEIALDHEAVSVDVLGPDQIAAKGMGGLVAVNRGGGEPARLIVLRYAGGGSGPTLGLVGKGVTFDSGGISLKPGAGMQEMKY